MNANCLNCQTIFIIKSGSTGKFCTKSCAATFNNKGRIRSTESKNKTKLSKLKSDIAKTTKDGFIPGARPYISIEFRNCTACNILFVSNINRPRRTCSKICRTARNRELGKDLAKNLNRRSQAEDRLFHLCKELDSSVVSNFVIKDGWDADIVFPNQQIAIAWNGPWHYKEMPGLKHSLKQVQNRDRIKTKLFTELGWMYIVFEDNIWTPETAFQYIKNVVRQEGFEPANLSVMSGLL